VTETGQSSTAVHDALRASTVVAPASAGLNRAACGPVTTRVLGAAHEPPTVPVGEDADVVVVVGGPALVRFTGAAEHDAATAAASRATTIEL